MTDEPGLPWGWRRTNEGDYLLTFDGVDTGRITLSADVSLHFVRLDVMVAALNHPDWVLNRG